MQSKWTISRSALLVSLPALLSSCSNAPTGEAVSTSTEQALRVERRPVQFEAPAGNLPTTRSTTVDGVSAAILPNGRLVTPAGVEVNVTAPKPFGLALSPTGTTLATINSGASRFSVSLIRDLGSAIPTVTRVDLDATFMGVVFLEGRQQVLCGGRRERQYLGRRHGSLKDCRFGKSKWSRAIRLTDPFRLRLAPAQGFKGTFPGNMAVSGNGRYLYVVDQGAFQVHVLDTTKIITGIDGSGLVTEPDNFAAVVNRIPSGRYPFRHQFVAQRRRALRNSRWSLSIFAPYASEPGWG